MPLWSAAAAGVGGLSAQQSVSAKNRTDSEGALRAFAVVHARGSEVYREMYVFVDFYT